MAIRSRVPGAQRSNLGKADVTVTHKPAISHPPKRTRKAPAKQGATAHKAKR
jgi:hypothetical protein